MRIANLRLCYDEPYGLWRLRFGNEVLASYETAEAAQAAIKRERARLAYVSRNLRPAADYRRKFAELRHARKVQQDGRHRDDR